MRRGLIICINRRLTDARPSCAARGSEALADALESLVAERALALQVERIHCFGRCERGPNVRIAPGADFVEGASLDDVEAIVERALATPGAAGPD